MGLGNGTREGEGYMWLAPKIEGELGCGDEINERLEVNGRRINFDGVVSEGRARWRSGVREII